MRYKIYFEKAQLVIFKPLRSLIEFHVKDSFARRPVSLLIKPGDIECVRHTK